MKKLLSFLLLLCVLVGSALAEEESTPVFEPLSWDLEVSPNTPNPDCFLPDNAGYHDDSIDIQIDTFVAYDTKIMRVRVKLTDVSQFRTATAGKYPSKVTRLTTYMTDKANAVIGISGDFFSYHDTGIVWRNGKRLRNRASKGRDTLVMDEQGDFHILPRTHTEDWDAYINGGGTVIHTWTFGPGLVIDGEPLTDLETVRLDCGKGKRLQRLAVGQTGPLEYMFLATGGPQTVDDAGLDLLQMAQLCLDNGMINAYNLDGSVSSTIAFQGEKINSEGCKQRDVGDCIWFATLVPSDEATQQ